MQLGMVGLGKMGANMTERLANDGHTLVVTDLNADAVTQAAANDNVTGADSLEDLVSKMDTPRAVWIMVPSGDATEQTVEQFLDLLDEDDIIIDGGNSNYKDTIRRGEAIHNQGLHYVDVGTSGGVWGLAEGYSMMVGGDDTAVERITPVLKTLAPGPETGWGHVGKTGSGHFVKMVHNGIEYGMMQAYAEGFDIMAAKEDFDLDMHQIAEIWRFGSVIRSWLLDLTAEALEEDQSLSDIAGYVNDSGEGRWTAQEAIDLAIPAPVISTSLFARFQSRRDDAYGNKILSAMRNQFGGHAVKKSEDA
ncbi:MAG: phosphogluconate dehydrogenase (NAD(+)-dependent, decarboxylating) [Chloroflexota bacterium]